MVISPTMIPVFISVWVSKNRSTCLRSAGQMGKERFIRIFHAINIILFYKAREL
jgi:hypothetical protein